MKPAPPVTRVFMRPRASRWSAPRLDGARGLLRSPRMRGLFVTFEGIDRSGKTTQAELLCEALGDEALGVREPGGTPAGERVRELLKDPPCRSAREAEALLFAAARAELVEQVIRPALEAGRVVVSRPLPRLLARLPGRRSRPRGRRGRAGQPLRHRRARARPDLPARARPGRRRRARRARATASRTRARRCSRPCSRPTSGSPRPTPGAGGAWTPRDRRTRCTREVLAEVEAARSGARA